MPAGVRGVGGDGVGAAGDGRVAAAVGFAATCWRRGGGRVAVTVLALRRLGGRLRVAAGHVIIAALALCPNDLLPT
jgi:hypothetical protein